MVNKFDASAFSELLVIAKGDRPQTVFSNEIGISKEHLSRLINCKTDSIPIPSTLRNIASSSQGRVTYVQLLYAANYLQDSDLENLDKDKKPLTAAILAALSNSQYEWALKSNNDYDLTIQFITPNSGRWFFLCSANKENRQICHQHEHNYFQVLKTPATSLDKFTFATSCQCEYTEFCKISPTNLNVNLSVILVDTHQLQVLEESNILSHNCTKIILPSLI